jgi:uncharacterized integral membrane protein
MIYIIIAALVFGALTILNNALNKIQEVKDETKKLK